MIALPGRTREVSEVEPPELRLRNGLLLLITLGQPVKHDGVEVDIWIHNGVWSAFRFLCEFLAHGSGFSLIRANTAGVALPRGKKLEKLLRPTNHHILERCEFVVNSQRFAERNGKGHGEAKAF